MLGFPQEAVQVIASLFSSWEGFIMCLQVSSLRNKDVAWLVLFQACHRHLSHVFLEVHFLNKCSV